ncbi:MAG: phosphoribosylanthranilate isomerase [Sphingomonadaceae bacterium]|nr:phosphoribosylanthranilate isomerase [Sphingomonadaceae bacterium]
MPVRIKICGVTTPEALDAAIIAGASHIGFNFCAASPRYITPEAAAALVARAAGRITPVALFVDANAQDIANIRRLTGIGTVQLHGAESPAFAAHLGGDVWKAVGVRERADISQAAAFAGAVSHMLYDAKPPQGASLTGGHGLAFDWTILPGARHPLPWFLAGGLNPQNVASAIRQSGASAVDVSSGVETGGAKDSAKIAAFIRAAADA